jgi:hypothetical protein
MAADYFGAGGDLFQGVMTGLGDFAEAGASREAGKLYGEAAGFAATGGALKDMMLKRQAFQTIGGSMADVGSAGFKNAGSAMLLMKSNAQQASIAKAINDVNTRIAVTSYTIQSKEAYAAAQAQEDAGIGSIVGGVLGAAGAIFGGGL